MSANQKITPQSAQDLKATHTPGPWYVGSARLVWVDGTDIAQVIRTNGDQATAMANARLIVGAPDLLNRLQLALDMLETFEGTEATCRTIRKTITKALG